MKGFLYLIFIFSFVACSNKGVSAPANFKVRFGNAVTLGQVQGGMTFGTFDEANTPFFNDLSLTDFSADVPQGISTLYMVAYSGPLPWEGTKYCGSIPLDIGTEETNLSIILSTSNCPLDPKYQEVMNTKIDNTNTFDSAIFGSALFGP
jgi:hypothetical protein